MKLKTNVFLWVFLSTAVPLLAITLYATVYSENLYRQEVQAEINASLGNLASEIRRRLLLERELLRGLSNVPAVEQFKPVLRDAALGRRHAEYIERTEALAKFIESFQAIIPSMSALRVLDARGNTVLRVLSGTRVASALENLGALPYVESEVVDQAFMRFLTALPPGDFGYVLLPQDDSGESAFEPPRLLDTVLSVEYGGRSVGYISAKVRQGPIDRLLHVAPRVQNGRLLIAELNPSDPVRDGLILYDDVTGVSLVSRQTGEPRLQDQYPQLYASVAGMRDGLLDSEDGRVRTYYREYLPYPDRLIVWLVAMRLDLGELGAPFQRIRAAILFSSLAALLASVVVARVGAQRITGPVMDLAQRLTDYAHGQRKLRVTARGPQEIRRASGAFNYMAETLEQVEYERDEAQAAMIRNAKLASVGQMAAGIGHEINNPVNNILSLTRLMERSCPAAEVDLKSDIASVREEAMRASRIVKAVLNFSRQVPPDYTWFEIRPWLEDTLRLVRNEARERGVLLALDLRGEPKVYGDPEMLKQALINLLLNAVQATPSNETVDVVAVEREGSLEITVADRGAGLTPEVMERVFDPFFTTKAVGEGSGLGLSIALGIVEQHEGALEIVNRSEGGVRATVTLPLGAQAGPLTERAGGGEEQVR